MSLVQKMNGNNKTFAQLAEAVLSSALNESRQCHRVDIVFDVYRQLSIKNAERPNRSACTAIQYKKIVGGYNIQQWQKFLCSSSNKTNLIKFFVEEWKLPQLRQMLQDKRFYVTCEDTCYKMTADEWVEEPALKSTHEEADTRLFLHALHAANAGSQAVIITAEDTDIMVLCLAFQKGIPCHIYQKRSKQNRVQFVDITKLASSIGNNICDSLIGLHAFTGCDTVSAFAGRGKVSALKLMKKNTTFQETFHQLGQSWDLSPQLFQKLEEFTCRLYFASSCTDEVNVLRYQLFCAKRGEVESSQLPPCKDSLFMHACRANYQTAIWKTCLQTCLIIPDPTNHGWSVDEDTFGIHWMQSPPAPDMVLELLACKCVRTCKLPTCSCLAYKLPCTDMCKLQTCSNQKQMEDDVDFELEDCDDNLFDDC